MSPELIGLARAMRAYPIFSNMFGRQSNAPAAIIAALAQTQQRAFITRDELIEIVSTKNARGPGADHIRAEAEANEESFVKALSVKAFAEASGAKAIEHLIALRGVRVPTASAILSWCFPAKWPVLDRRAWASLAAFCAVDAKASGYVFSAAEYGRFAELVDELRTVLGWTPQVIDRWLYAFDKCELAPEALA